MRLPWGREVPKESEARRQEVLVLLSKRLKECDDALRQNDKDVDALFTKAVYLARIEEHWRSLDCLMRITEIDPGYPGVWHFMASEWQRVGETKKADFCLRRAEEQSSVVTVVA